MAKILLVEDDNNLREIYEARLQAEGYDIVSARDGEEALTVAMKERPDLIISDVMMPKISGFDMLDIIRSTEETKYVKVIMMTALSQAEDKERATKLGADRYLVKSQVTLEDVAKVAREVLEGASDQNDLALATPQPPTAVQSSSDDASAATNPSTPPTVVADDASAATNMASDSQAMSSINPDTYENDSKANGNEKSAIDAQIESFIEVKKTTPETPTVTEVPTVNAVSEETPLVQSEKLEVQPSPLTEPEPEQKISKTVKKVINPISDPTVSRGPDLENLLKIEEEKERMAQIANTVANNNAEPAIESDVETTAQSPANTTDPTAPIGAGEPSQTIVTKNEELPVKMPTELDDQHAELTENTVNAETVISAPAPAPVIPHQNGSSIDGVVPQTPAAQPAATPVAPTAPAPSATPAPASDTIDPNSISL